MCKESIKEIVECFYNSTGITTLYIDDTCQIKEISKGFTVEQLMYLQIDEIINFIKDRLKKGSEETDTLFTFHTKGNCIYNIVFIKKENGIAGAFVSGVMVFTTPQNEHSILNGNSQDMDHTISRQKILESIAGMTMVTILRIKSLGKLLVSIVRLYHSDKPTLQVIINDTYVNDILENDLDEIREIHLKEYIDEGLFARPEFFSTLKDIISKGDVLRIEQLVANTGGLPLDQILKENSIRSLKNYCISTAISCFCFSMETSAPYYQISDITYEFVRRIEKLNSTPELLSIMKTILIKYTKIVALYNYHTYTKPIKKVMLYIQNNYSKKISLQDLATHTGLSTFYLSALIKKETNCSLCDNINQVRIQNSKYLLVNSNVSILEVAQRTGFPYQNYFANVFKKIVGISPTDYRNQKPISTLSTEKNLEITGKKRYDRLDND